MNPYTIAGLLLALIVACGGAFGFGRRYESGQHAREEILIAKAGDAAAERAAGVIAGLQPKYTTINRAIERTLEKLPPTPEECNAPREIVEQINEARRAP